MARDPHFAQRTVIEWPLMKVEVEGIMAQLNNSDVMEYTLQTPKAGTNYILCMMERVDNDYSKSEYSNVQATW